jgi:hypothetical protein
MILWNPDVKGALHGVLNLVGEDGKLTIEQYAYLLKYFSFGSDRYNQNNNNEKQGKL